MFRIIAMGLATLSLAACQPAAEPAAPTEVATSAANVASAADEAARQAEWDALESRYLDMETVPSAPLDALEWREVHCNFMGGELGGDPEQDRAINAWIEENCARQLDDARTLRSVMATDTAAVARIDAFLGRHGG